MVENFTSFQNTPLIFKKYSVKVTIPSKYTFQFIFSRGIDKESFYLDAIEKLNDNNNSNLDHGNEDA